MESKKIDIAYCRLKRNEKEFLEYNDNFMVIPQNQNEAMNNLLYKMSEISFCCYIYDKNILNEYGIRFDENTKYGEDREFNWKYLCHCKTISYIDSPLYYYRINNASVTKSSPTWSKTDLLNAIKRTEEYLKTHKCQFYNEFKSYMYSRTTWTVAKTFAVGKQ